MTKRFWCLSVLMCAALVLPARPARAQQTLTVSFGYQTTPGASRDALDILLIEHADIRFNINDFNGPTYGGEWLIPIGNFLETGVGAAFSRRTVPTVHARFSNPDGSPITRDLTLAQVPVELTVRVLPLGQSYIVQPYAGAGIAVINWQYRESGSYVARNLTVFQDYFQQTSIAVGPAMVFGLRVARDHLAVGFETRYRRALGTFDPIFANFQKPVINLGGWALQFTTGVRIGQ